MPGTILVICCMVYDITLIFVLFVTLCVSCLTHSTGEQLNLKCVFY